MLEISRAKPEGKALAAAVLRALEITRPGPGVFTRRQKAQRDVALAQDVLDRVVSGVQVKRAIPETAAARNSTPDVVERAWRQLYPRKIGRNRLSEGTGKD
ncbi:MAG: hypothetical protein ACREM3_05250 [Candidatus Rokuibacteriota bacterium]